MVNELTNRLAHYDYCKLFVAAVDSLSHLVDIWSRMQNVPLQLFTVWTDAELRDKPQVFRAASTLIIRPNCAKVFCLRHLVPRDRLLVHRNVWHGILNSGEDVLCFIRTFGKGF